MEIYGESSEFIIEDEIIFERCSAISYGGGMFAQIS
jgi:hypothetical protein